MKGVIAAVGIQAVILVLYFQRFPVFPQFQSADFVQHVRIAQTLSQALVAGHLPSLSQAVLYYDVELYLAGLMAFFPKADPVQLSRLAMAFLVALAPLVFWDLSREAFPEWPTLHWMVPMAYVVSGFVWFEMVFDSGLYANFIGVLASLLLASSSLRLLRRDSSLPLSLVGLGASALFAEFSHYSTLLIFPAVVLLFSWNLRDLQTRKRAASGLAVILAPIAAALALVPSLLSLVLSFTFGGSTSSPITQTPLSSVMPLPVLAYLVGEVDAPSPLRSDIAALLALAFAAVFLRKAWRTRDQKTSFLAVWLLTIIVVAPLNDTAWRFAFVALTPLTYAMTWGFYYTLRKAAPRMDWGHPLRPQLSTKHEFYTIGILLILLPSALVSAWSPSVFALSVGSDSGSYAATDGYDLQALSYISIHNDCGFKFIYKWPSFAVQPCRFAELTDWRLTYSSLFGGPEVMQIMPSGLATPETVETAAAQVGAEYFIATNITLLALPYCAHLQEISISALNSTAGSSIELGVSVLPKLNTTDGPLQVFLDGQPFGRFAVDDGQARVAIEQLAPGHHELRVRYQFSGVSNVLEVEMGSSSAPTSIPLVGNACDPWGWYSDDYGGASLVYSNAGVEVWCIVKSCQQGS